MGYNLDAKCLNNICQCSANFIDVGSSTSCMPKRKCSELIRCDENQKCLTTQGFCICEDYAKWDNFYVKCALKDVESEKTTSHPMVTQTNSTIANTSLASFSPTISAEQEKNYQEKQVEMIQVRINPNRNLKELNLMNKETWTKSRAYWIRLFLNFAGLLFYCVVCFLCM